MTARVFLLACIAILSLAVPAARAQDAIDRLDMEAHAALDANKPELAIKDWTELLKLDPKNANAFFNRAAAYEELTGDEPNQAAMAADDDKALADYTSAIQLNPDDPDALEHRARIYAHKIGDDRASDTYTDNMGKAIADYEAAFTLRSKGMDDPKGWLTSMPKPDDATGNLARWDLIIKLDPKDTQAYLNRALIHEQASDFASAAADYGEAARLDPRDVTTLVKQASDFFAVNQYEKAIAGYTAALGLDPDNVEALTQRSHIYVRRMMNDDFGSPVFEEDMAKAMADEEALLKIPMRVMESPKEWLEKQVSVSTLPMPALACRDMIVKLDPKDAKACINRAAAYDTNGAYADAAADYSVAIRANPQDAGLYIERGEDFVQTGDYEKAIADFNEAFRLKPASGDDSAKAHTGRALSYQEEELYDKAFADFSEVIKATPNDFNAWFNRGCAYEQKGDYEKAIADFNEAIRINPQTTWLRYERLQTWLAKGDKEKADAEYAALEKLFSSQIEDDPKESTAYTDRAELYTHLGKYDKAIADCTKAMDVDKYDEDIIKQLANIYLKTGDAKNAVRYFDFALGKDHDPSGTYQGRARAHALAGDYEKALADLQQALDLGAGQSAVLGALARIYAACPKGGLRDAPKAAGLAIKACTYSKWKDADYIDTLAAAEAAAGKFDSAMNWQQYAIGVANAQKGGDRKDEKAMRAMSARLALYRQKKPYVDDDHQ